MKKFALVGTLAALTIATTACGGGSDTLSEDDYIDKLEDICSRADRDLEDIADPEDYPDVVDASEEAISITNDAIDDIKELKPPKDLQGDHDDYVAALEDVVSGFEDLRDAADDEDDDAITDAGETISDATDEADSVADDLGADKCVSVGEEEPTDEPTDTTVEEPTDTTEPDEPVDTTEPDEPVDTTEPDDGTIPAITVPPVEMTMPTETEPPVVSGSDIGTIDFNELTLPAGYTFENADAETLTGIQDLYAESFAGQIQAIGGAGVVDDATGEVFSVFVFFWNAELDEATGSAFVDDLVAADDVQTAEPVTTPIGLVADRILYTDQTEALVVWGGTVSIVAFGDAGSAGSLANLVDALASA